MAFLDAQYAAAGPVLFLLSFLCLAFPLLLLYRDSRRPKNKLPPASTTIPKPPPIKVAQLRIYPIKSCRGIVLSKAKMLKTGLEFDRNWMFVDEVKRNFLTIRQISKLTLIDTALTENEDLVISIRNSEPKVSITISARPTQKWLKTNCELATVEIWEQPVDGYLYSADLTQPFSAFLGQEVRLAYQGPRPRQLIGPGSSAVLGRPGSTKFADFMPVQVANLRSIDELNFRLKERGEQPITIERFRPNVVVDGDEPWYEDVWKTVRIGAAKTSVTMDVVVRCARCQVPNVDPDTADKHKKQPVSGSSLSSLVKVSWLTSKSVGYAHVLPASRQGHHFQALLRHAMCAASRRQYQRG